MSAPGSSWWLSGTASCLGRSDSNTGLVPFFGSIQVITLYSIGIEGIEDLVRTGSTIEKA